MIKLKHLTLVCQLISSIVFAQSIPDTIIKKDNYQVDAASGAITLKAGKSIILKPNSWIKAGSTFLATITKNEDYKPVTYSNQNYVFTRTYQTAMQTFNPALAKESDVIEQITYFDGLGRPMQQLALKATPNKKDIVTHISYDAYGRQDKNWLPYPATTNNTGSYRVDASTPAKQYYQTQYPNDFLGENLTNINAFSKTEFEASPLNRVLKQAAPGKDWALNSGHAIVYNYQSNTAQDKVYKFKVNFLPKTNHLFLTSLETNGYYSIGTLYKTVTKDENHTSGTNHTIEEFKDKENRVVLKRTYANINGVSTAHNTYYVYSIYGNLSYVIPPKVNLDNGLTATNLSELCYQYQYDSRDRLGAKKIPGKQWEYIVYDNLDRPVLTQDANLKTKNQWLFTKYDVFGRVAYTGLYTTTSTFTKLHDTFNLKTTQQNYETKVTTGNGYSNSYYTNSNFPSTGLKLLTINYYDNYYFNNQGLNLPATANQVPIINYNNTNPTLTKGLPTASKVAVLNTSTQHWITSIFGYNKKAQLIYTATKNTFLETQDTQINTVDFAGKVTQTNTAHNKTGHDVLNIQDQLTYDHQARLLKQTKQINTKNQQTIALNTYNSLGLLVKKGIGGKTDKPLQNIDYNYNVRGWLTQINNPKALENDLFSFKIEYNNGVNALYNGNISSTIWKTANDHQERNYQYNYDALNRITSGISNNGNYNLNSITYDKMGNIKSLERKGLTTLTSNPVASNFGTIDKLDYVYNGNKLQKVTDFTTNTQGFNDGNTLGNDYTYDANGNLLEDKNKGITTIEYNHLNLPTFIRSRYTATLNYVYDANGTKLAKILSQRNGSTTTEYAGNFIYEKFRNGLAKLKFFNHSEGYVEPKDENNYSLGFNYVYQYKDHLGNIRLSYSDTNGNGAIETSSEILEENNYYPYGLKHKGYNNVVNSTNPALKYKFGGKEYQDELGLGWYDITARNYDPAIGRWMNLDPLAEQMRRHSPYNFAFDNPIYFIDPDGMMPFGGGGPPINGDGIARAMQSSVNKAVESVKSTASSIWGGLKALASAPLVALHTVVENGGGDVYTSDRMSDGKRSSISDAPDRPASSDAEMVPVGGLLTVAETKSPNLDSKIAEGTKLGADLINTFVGDGNSNNDTGTIETTNIDGEVSTDSITISVQEFTVGDVYYNGSAKSVEVQTSIRDTTIVKSDSTKVQNDAKAQRQKSQEEASRLLGGN